MLDAYTRDIHYEKSTLFVLPSLIEVFTLYVCAHIDPTCYHNQGNEAYIYIIDPDSVAKEM